MKTPPKVISSVAPFVGSSRAIDRLLIEEWHTTRAVAGLGSCCRENTP
jgi:hypothetical protein